MENLVAEQKAKTSCYAMPCQDKVDGWEEEDAGPATE
jgi:hypothetical protein